MTDRANRNLRDANLIQTKALSNGAGSVSTTAFDTEARGSRDAFLAEVEMKISLPALTTTELPDTETMTAKVECDNDSAFGSARLVADSVLVQTGAGGAGAAAASARLKLPSDLERYTRVTVTKTGTGDCSGKVVTVELLF